MEPEESTEEAYTEEFTLATGEKIIIRKYVYTYPDTKHIMYDMIFSTSNSRHIYRAVETLPNVPNNSEDKNEH